METLPVLFALCEQSFDDLMQVNHTHMSFRALDEPLNFYKKNEIDKVHSPNCCLQNGGYFVRAAVC